MNEHELAEMGCLQNYREQIQSSENRNDQLVNGRKNIWKTHRRRSVLSDELTNTNLLSDQQLINQKNG